MTLPSRVHPSWEEPIGGLFSLASMEKLRKEIIPAAGTGLRPEKANIFRVFEMPTDQIRVAVLGLDPYPREGMAMGYAFAVPHGFPIPPSLRIIAQELGITRDNTTFCPDLQTWRNQGVFLLNTGLTMEEGKTGGHVEYWKEFITGVIKAIDLHQNPVWLLLGKKAQAYSEYITHHDRIVMAGHPASEVYPGTKNTFLGTGCFDKVNSLLTTKIKFD